MYVSIVDKTQTRAVHGRSSTVLLIFFTFFLGLGVWLFAPSDTGEIQAPADLASYEYVDGVMSQVQLPLLEMNAYSQVNGQTTLKFRVPESNLRYFDVVHLRAHSSIGLPTRIYFKEIEGELLAVYKIDAPANSGSGK